MWDIAWDLWEHRNGILHEADNMVLDIETHKTNHKVVETYSRLQGLILPAHDKHLISLSLARLLKKDKTVKEVRIGHALAAINGRGHKHWSRRHSQEVLIMGMQQSMRNCLRPRTPRTSPLI